MLYEFYIQITLDLFLFVFTVFVLSEGFINPKNSFESSNRSIMVYNRSLSISSFYSSFSKYINRFIFFFLKGEYHNGEIP